MPPFEIFVRFGVKGGKVISIKERGLTKVAAVCRPKFAPSLSKFKGKHFIRRRAKNQLTQQKETLSSSSFCNLYICRGGHFGVVPWLNDDN